MDKMDMNLEHRQCEDCGGNQNKINMNVERRQCNECGGKMRIDHMDKNGIYLECLHCGNGEFYVFQSDEEAQYYREETLLVLMGRLRAGFWDWEKMNWTQLYKDFIALINQQPYLEEDLQVQMGLVACLTKGFQSMDAESYRQCKILVKFVDKRYKQRMRLLKAQMKRTPALSDAMCGYRVSRNRYAQIRNEYLQTKRVYKMLWSAVKKLIFK